MLYRELVCMPNPTKDLALQQAQRFFAMDQISMHEMTTTNVAQGLGSNHRALAIAKALLAGPRKTAAIERKTHHETSSPNYNWR